MIGAILSAAGGIFKGVLGWFGLYGSKENQASRVQEDEIKKADALNKALQEKDLDEIRKTLSGNK